MSSISPIFHGIPRDLELAKRDLARYVMSKDKLLSAVYFLLPNGDVYLLEPYAWQQNLTVNNLGFRDYFKGVIASHNTYLGGVIQ